MRTSATLRHLVGPFELIHAQAGPRLLRLARLGILGLWIFKLLLDPLWRLADLPVVLLHPVGLLALVPADWLAQSITPFGLIALWGTTLAALLLSLTNRLSLISAPLAAFLLTVYSSLIRSYGPAVHTDITLLLGVYALALFAWAEPAQRRLGGPTRTETSSAPLITIVALLCLTYCLVGLNRLIVSPASLTGNSMEIWAIDASLRAYYFNTGIGWHLPEWPWVVLFLRLGLPVITFFEITAPLCLVWPHYRWVFIPVMLSFHLLSLVLMNIFFFDDMLLYLLLIDWSRRFPFLHRGAR